MFRIVGDPVDRHFEPLARNPEAAMRYANASCSAPSPGILPEPALSNTEGVEMTNEVSVA